MHLYVGKKNKQRVWSEWSDEMRHMDDAARFHLFHYGIDGNACQAVATRAACAAPGGSGIDCAADELRRCARRGVSRGMGSVWEQWEQAGEG